MKLTPWQKTFPLHAYQIDLFSERVDEALREIKTERLNRLRIRLSLEEALLRLRDRFGQDAEVSAVIASRFGRPFIQIELEGEPYNPLSRTETELEDWNSSLLPAIGLSPRYNYTGRVNVLKLTLPHKGMSPMEKIILAFILGVVVGMLGTFVLPAGVKELVSKQFLTPLYTLWLRILNVISGPVIFLMVIATLLNAGKITERGGNSRMVIIRYFLFSFLIAAPGAIVSAIVFHVPFELDIFSGELASGFLNDVVKIIPNEFVTPFMEAQTPQLLIMAIVLGTAINAIGSPVRHLAGIFKQANMVGMLLTDWVSRLVPYVMGILIGFEIWNGETKVLSGIWKSMLLALVTASVIMLINILYVSSTKKVKPQILIKKIWRPFAVALKTGSLDEAYGLTEKSCVMDLGIDKEYTSVSLPHGLVLYMPISAVGTLVFTVYVAHLYNVSTTPIWYFMAIILSVMVFVATPPVPGANLIAYTVLFPVLGIPESALIDAMVFDIVFGIFAGAGNQLVLQLELILQAAKIGLLDRGVLLKE